MTTTQSKTFWSAAVCRLARRCESHEMLFVLPLPAECWHEVVAPRPVGACGGDQPVDGVELVVAREDHRLALLGAGALRVLDLLLAGLEEDVGAEDVEEALAFEHLAPEVVGAVAVGVGRVAGAAVDGRRGCCRG